MKYYAVLKKVGIKKGDIGFRALGMVPVCDSKGLHACSFYTNIELAISRAKEWQRTLKHTYVILEFEV